MGPLMFYCCPTSFWENDRVISWVTREGGGGTQTNKAPAIPISPQEDNNAAQGGNDTTGIY